MSFQEHIREWASLDSKINEMNATVKDLRNKRSNLEETIIRHVESNSLNNATIRLNDSKLQFANSKVMPPLTYKFLKESLLEITNDEDETNDILSYIREKRQPKESLVIRRYFNN